MPNIALCSTDDVKEVDKSDSNLFTDTVGLEGFLTCCNFLISQIYASFHLEPLVYKEMDTKIKIITDFYGQPKILLYDLTSFILPEFFNSDGNPVQLILYDSNLNSPAAMAFQ